MKNKDVEFIKSSFHKYKGNTYFIAKIKNERFLAVSGGKKPKNLQGCFEMKEYPGWFFYPLSDINAEVIREIFPECLPKIVKKEKFIFGFGYRSPYIVGNIIQAKIAKIYKNVTPILAQQSVRELQRTKRTFRDVLNSATWAVFEAGINFWGADADHLKNPEDARYPARLGFTHFTIDPSEKLISFNFSEAEREFLKFSRQEQERILKKYNGRPFAIDIEYNFSKEEVKRFAVKYKNVFGLIEEFLQVIKREGRKNAGIEISIDETEEITTPEELLYLLSELKRRKIRIDEVAPRFPGHFEKAIDYFSYKKNGKPIKNIKEFEKHFFSLYNIAKFFKVKLCLHSGSDKFSVYPVVKKITDGDIHIKTAGTFFLEEVRLLAKVKPEEFKKIFQFSKEVFETERTSYSLSTDLKNIPDLNKLGGEEIFELLHTEKGNKDLRQVLHVSYGKILTDPVFLKSLESTLKCYENELYKIFSLHIKKHLKNFR